MSFPWRFSVQGISVALRVTPRGGMDAIDGIETLANGRSVVKVRVRAIAEGGEANRAVTELLARLHPFRDDGNAPCARLTCTLSQVRFECAEDGPPCPMLSRHVGRGDTVPLLLDPELSEAERAASTRGGLAPADVAAVLRRAIERDLTRRYPSMREFRAALLACDPPERIAARTMALHEHNEDARTAQVLARLREGARIALDRKSVV